MNAASGANGKRRIAAAAAVLVAATGALPLAFAVDRGLHAGQVLRGVTAGGLSIQGKDAADAERALAELGERIRGEPLPIRVRALEFSIPPADVAFRLDAKETALAALREGRRGGILEQFGWWASRLRSTVDVPLAVAIDEGPLDAAVAIWESKAIDDPPFEGAVAVKGSTPSPDYPRKGHGIDREGARRAVREGLGRARREPVDLPIADVSPRTSREAVDAAVTVAKSIVAGPVTLSVMVPSNTTSDLDGARSQANGADGRRAGAAPEGDADAIKTLTPSKKKKKKKKDDADEEPAPTRVSVRWSAEDLARAIRSRGGVEGDAPKVELYLDPIVIDEALQKLRPTLEKKPEDARFEVDDRDQVTILPSHAGTRLDADKSAAAIMAAAATPEREGPLPVEIGEPPELSTEAAVALHIDHLVAEHTTRHACCQPRVKNIHRIADLVDGRVVRPGETFSLNAAAGERTRANGFVLAPSIADGEMVDTMGGGVSQFATTFFNAMFYGGYDIIERQPHSFYFSRYPMGHEATLSWPKPDLIIRNDTDAGILIKTVYSKTSITVKLYGDNGGRKVRAKVSSKQDIVEPPVELIPNPKLDPEKEKVKEHGQVGWSVIVARVLTFADGTTKEERRKVTYKPRVRRVQVHPCRIPKGQDGYTGDPCPKPESEEEGASPDASGSPPPPPPPNDAPAPF